MKSETRTIGSSIPNRTFSITIDRLNELRPESQDFQIKNLKHFSFTN